MTYVILRLINYFKQILYSPFTNILCILIIKYNDDNDCDTNYC